MCFPSFFFQNTHGVTTFFLKDFLYTKTFLALRAYLQAIPPLWTDVYSFVTEPWRLSSLSTGAPTYILYCAHIQAKHIFFALSPHPQRQYPDGTTLAPPLIFYRSINAPTEIFFPLSPRHYSIFSTKAYTQTKFFYMSRLFFLFFLGASVHDYPWHQWVRFPWSHYIHPTLGASTNTLPVAPCAPVHGKGEFAVREGISKEVGTGSPSRTCGFSLLPDNTACPTYSPVQGTSVKKIPIGNL